MKYNGLESVITRNTVYRDWYRLLSIVLFGLVILIVLLIGLAVYQRVSFPTPKYFATTPDGRLLPIIRLDQPIYTDPVTVSEWFKKALIETYSIDFVTWRKRIQEAQQYFTLEGYQKFVQALQDSRNLEAVKELRQVVSIEIEQEPELLRQGQLTPTVPYSWDFKVPVLVTYQNSENNRIEQKGMILVRIERASFRMYRNGLAIKQLVLEDR